MEISHFSVYPSILRNCRILSQILSDMIFYIHKLILNYTNSIGGIIMTTKKTLFLLVNVFYLSAMEYQDGKLISRYKNINSQKNDSDHQNFINQHYINTDSLQFPTHFIKLGNKMVPMHTLKKRLPEPTDEQPSKKIKTLK